MIPKFKILPKIESSTSLIELNLTDSRVIDENFNKAGQLYSKLYKINLSILFFRNLGFFQQCLYDKNRPIDQNRVDNLKKLSEDQEINFLNGHCTIGYINWQQPKILDGQHRLCVANSLPICLGYVNLISFDNLSQMWDYYLKINQNAPVPDYYKSSESLIKDYLITVCQNISNKYPKFFSGSRSCHKPNLNIDNLKESLFKIYTDPDNEILKMNFDLSNSEQSVIKVMNDIYDFNDSLKTKTSDYFFKCCSNSKAATEAYKKIINKGELYLGMFFSGSNDSIFYTKYLQFINNKYNYSKNCKI